MKDPWDQCSSLECSHTFHEYCLNQLSIVTNTPYASLKCPVCRFDPNCVVDSDSRPLVPEPPRPQVPLVLETSDDSYTREVLNRILDEADLGGEPLNEED